MADSILMSEFEELEGLKDQDNTQEDLDGDEDDADFKPVQASSLTADDRTYEMSRRDLKSTGFANTDCELLQKAFDAEFLADVEDAKARRREAKKRAQLQASLQKRRALMERTLFEEEMELTKNFLLAKIFESIKLSQTNSLLKVDVNSISCRSLAKSLRDNNTITYLDISNNNLDDHAGAYIGRILKYNNTIKHLELDNNNFASDTIVAIGETLKINNTLVHISLDSNPLFAEDNISAMTVFADGVRTSTSLTTLNLWRTQIGSSCGKILCSSIKESPTILFCDVGHNPMDVSDVKDINDVLDSNIRKYEAYLRSKQENDQLEANRMKSVKDVEDAEKKQHDLLAWLEDKRRSREKEARQVEFERVAEAQAILVEQRKREAAEREKKKKEAEEAAAKKAAKGKKK